MKHNEKGITLIEIIVVMAIIGILSAAIGGIFSTYLKLERQTRELSYAKDSALMVQDYIYHQVKWAEEVAYVDTLPSLAENEAAIYWDATLGLIHGTQSGEKIIYPLEVFHKFQVDLSFEKGVSDVTDFEVSVSGMREGVLTVLYKENASVKAINMLTRSIEDDTEGRIVVFKVPST